MAETQTKLRPLPLRVHSRVRVVSVVIWASYSHSQRDSLLKYLGATGTIVSFDPRWTLPCHVKLDNGNILSCAEDNLEMLEP